MMPRRERSKQELTGSSRNCSYGSGHSRPACGGTIGPALPGGPGGRAQRLENAPQVQASQGGVEEQRTGVTSEAPFAPGGPRQGGGVVRLGRHLGFQRQGRLGGGVGSSANRAATLTWEIVRPRRETLAAMARKESP